MLGIIKSSIGTLFKWGLILIGLIIVVKLITSLVPSLSQDSIKDKISEGSSTSTGSSFGESVANFFKTSYATNTKPLAPKFKMNPSYDNTAGVTEFDYEQYGGEAYQNSNANNEWGTENKWGEGSESDWNKKGTDWDQKQTKWDMSLPQFFVPTSTKR